MGANDYAWYVQDRWHPIARLSITAGLRPDWISGRDEQFKVTTPALMELCAESWRGLCVDKEPEKCSARELDQDHRHLPTKSYLGTAATSTVTTTDTYYNPDGSVYGSPIITPGSTSSFLGKTFDPHRHQGYVKEWLLGYRTPVAR